MVDERSEDNILSPMLRERSGYKIYSSPSVSSTPLGHQENCNIYSTPASDNVYSTPTVPTYQAVDRAEESKGTEFLKAPCHYPAKPSPKGYKVSECLSYLSPSKFVTSPLDNSGFNRSSYRNLEKTGSIASIAELLLGLMATVMTSESFLLFPMFLLQYKWEGLLIYLFLLLLLGAPIFIMEAILGGLEMTSSVVVWSYLSPVMSGLGPALLTVSLFLVAKTVAVTSYCIVYMLYSVRSVPPWSACEPWWSPDQRCVPTSEINHQHWSQSLVCTLFNAAGDACYSHTLPSHVQFWQKYVLQIDLQGLRVLGELGAPNLRLITISAVIWTSFGFMAVFLKRRTLKLASVGTAILLLLLIILFFRNIVTENVLSSVRPIFDSSDAFSDGMCWAEALALVIVGLSLFQGNVGTLASRSKGSGNVILVAATVVVFHLLYILLCALVVLPLLPSHLNVQEMRQEKEFGYFPLVLLPLRLGHTLEAKVSCLMVFTAITFSGFNHIFAVCTNFMSVFRNTKKRWMLVSWFVCSVGGFLLTLPLLYEAGPSLLLLYHRFGYEKMNLVLGSIVSVLVFWFHGSKRLAIRASEGQPYSMVLRLMWLVNPLLLFALVLVHFMFCERIAEPAPSPSWAFNLGVFFASLSSAQVLVGILVSAVRKLLYGSASTASMKSARSKSELLEKNKSEAPTYKCFEMF